MQFQVPQFIETEDKVVGPLSLRQFGYIAGGALVSAFFYFMVQTWLWVIISMFLAAIVIALAFVKVEGRSFIAVAFSAFHFYWRPQTYVWRPAALVSQTPKHDTGEEDASSLSKILERAAPVKRAASTPTQSHPVAHAPAGEPSESESASAEAQAKYQSKIQAQSQAKLAQTVETAPLSREKVSAGDLLHKSWEELQTGSSLARKNSDRQFIEKKMGERYQIFQKIAGDRNAAKRVDYR